MSICVSICLSNTLTPTPPQSRQFLHKKTGSPSTVNDTLHLILLICTHIPVYTSNLPAVNCEQHTGSLP